MLMSRNSLRSLFILSRLVPRCETLDLESEEMHRNCKCHFFRFVFLSQCTWQEFWARIIRF